MSITVLIADDHPLMRSALRTCLAAEPDIDVIAEAADGREAVSLAQQLHPDVVLLDVRMPVMDGVEATSQLTRQPAPTKVVLLTTFNVDDYIVDGLRAGASGFLLKDARPEEIVNAVRAVAAGDASLSPAVTKRLLDRYLRRLPSASAAAARRLADLTERELEVLRRIAQGQSNHEIAATLNIAESSVKTHVGHLLMKLDCPDRVHLVIFAYENGLASDEAGLTD